MCGIAGMVLAGHAKASTRILGAMTDRLAHRGPDDRGVWISEDGAVGLGHRRLSIIDLSPLGRQPMASRSGRYVITYNGEIYNFRDLRRELEADGATFRGGSDTEVLLAAFDRWGVEAAVPRLAGMFAFGVWDRNERVLWLARDRLGIKPLHYHVGADRLVFASELGAMTDALGRPPISRAALASYLRYGYVPSPYAIYEGIEKLPPGALLAYRPGQEPRLRRYWRIDDAARRGLEAPYRGGEDEAIEALDVLLRRVVREHMIADTPLGVLLSGGIDSSSVTAIMQAISPRPVHSYAIGFEDRRWNEAPHAKSVARHLGTAHTELYLTEDEARAVIPNLPDIYDEPFADVSQIPTFLVSRLARRDVTVVLTGDGGDEAFGGYNRYVYVSRFWGRLSRLPRAARLAAAKALRAVPPAAWDRLADGAGALLPRGAVPALLGDKVGKLAAVLGAGDIAGVHRMLVSQWQPPVPVLGDGRRGTADERALPLPQADDVSRQMCEDTATYLPDDILTKVDRASMAVGLEARPPLLDHRVIEFAWSLPPAWKIRDGQGKHILRRVLSRYVPEALTQRPKMGFGVPIGDWLRGPLRDWAEAALDETRLKREGFLDPAPVRRAWAEHLSGRADRSGALWTALMFQLWIERHVRASSGARDVRPAGAG